jgi:hypothetical protein
MAQYVGSSEKRKSELSIVLCSRSLKLKKLLRHEREVNKQLRLELVDRVRKWIRHEASHYRDGSTSYIKMPVKNDRAS